MVVSNGSATFTATNFSEVRSGVTQDPLTPAFDAIAKVRPMNVQELKSICHIGSTRLLGAPAGPPPSAVAPGRGVAGVKLGQTAAQVKRTLGAPLAAIGHQADGAAA